MKQRLVVLSVALVALTSAGSAPASTGRSSFAVFLVRGEHVSPVRRVAATVTPARAALEALLRGPTAAERRRGYTTAIPAGTTLRSVALADRLLVVDLSRRFEAGGGSLSMLLRIAQVAHTATQFAGVEHVTFRLDGRPVTTIGGEGVIVSPPIGRADVEGQAPPILVERPLPGDRVSTPLVVSGTAHVFEAQFVVDVRTAAGKLLAERSVGAGTGTGGRGSFRVTIPLAAPAGDLVVVAYDRSAKDGSRIGLVRVPVTLVTRRPTLSLTHATVDRAAQTVDVRLRICFAAGPGAKIEVTERRTVHGRVVATLRWVPQGEKPVQAYPFACRSSWRLEWLLAPSLRGAGSYSATIRVRDASGRWTPPVVVRAVAP